MTKLLLAAAVVLLLFNANASGRVNRSSTDSLLAVQRGTVTRSIEILGRSNFGYRVRDLTTKEILDVSADLNAAGEGIATLSITADGIQLVRFSAVSEPGEELGVVTGVSGPVQGVYYLEINGQLYPAGEVDLINAVGKVAVGDANGVTELK